MKKSCIEISVSSTSDLLIVVLFFFVKQRNLFPWSFLNERHENNVTEEGEKYHPKTEKQSTIFHYAYLYLKNEQKKLKIQKTKIEKSNTEIQNKFSIFFY